MAADAPRSRVLILTSTVPRWRRDAEPGFSLNLARELNAGFDIELIATHAPGHLPKRDHARFSSATISLLVASLAGHCLPSWHAQLGESVKIRYGSQNHHAVPSAGGGNEPGTASCTSC